MGFTIPPNTILIGTQIVGSVMDLMQKADTALDGKPGSGDRKKAWLMEAARDAMKTQDLIKADLMTPAQEESVLNSVDKVVDAVFAVVETAKLFQTPAA